MTAPKRIAFARIAQESNVFNPVLTELRDFTSSHWLEGAALRAACGPGGHEVAGFVKRAELAGFLEAVAAHPGEIEAVPILSAWSVSGGPLSRACFEELERRLCEELARGGPLDGVFLALHGAMGVDGLRDPDSRLIESAKRAAGGAPVAVTHDLHANLTRRRVAAADAVVAYGTNPHRDHARVGRRAGEILIGKLLGRCRPTTAWRTLPMILGGGMTIDFLPPVRSIFRRMRALERSGEVLAASAFMVHPWNDDPALGWSTVVITDGDQAKAERFADELAEACWAVRHRLPPAFEGASQAIASARKARLRRKLGAVLLADASDVVTAGAAGDSTHLLKALIDEGAGMLSYAAVRDPAAVKALWDRPEGAEVETTLGGKLDPASSPSITVRGTILHKRYRSGFEHLLVLAVGDVRVVVTEGPAMVMKPSFYRDAGLDPWKADVVMVKNFFPFLLFFLPFNRKTIFVKTRGTTDFDAAYRLQFDGPVHPREVVTEWRSRDRLRRGLGEA